MRHLLLICLAVMALVPRGVFAQESLPVSEGSRVRVFLAPQPRSVEGWTRPQELRGTLLDLRPDSAVLRVHPGAGPLVVATGAISRFEVSRGVDSRLVSASRQALWFAALGAVEFALLDSRGERFGSVSLAASAGAASGALVGAVMGAAFPRERWRRLRLPR